MSLEALREAWGTRDESVAEIKFLRDVLFGIPVAAPEEEELGGSSLATDDVVLASIPAPKEDVSVSALAETEQLVRPGGAGTETEQLAQTGAPRRRSSRRRRDVYKT